MTSAMIHSDGSGLATGGPAGVGFVAEVDGIMIEGALELRSATNQQAEILAAAYALTVIDPCDTVIVVSDSEYVVKGINEWIVGWVSREWRTAAGKPVKNQPHWRRLLEAIAAHGAVTFEWTRGHAGNERNERADELAGQARLDAIETAAGITHA